VWIWLQGIFDYLIATDESLGPVEPEPEPEDAAAAAPPVKKKAKGKKKATDAEFGVARGVDFQGVSTVINVDMPLSQESYTHRAGRTARAGASGSCLSS
jgi:ATP-dependent RNA helicase DDX56/DBP9